MSNVVNFEDRVAKTAAGMMQPRVLPTHSRGGRTSAAVENSKMIPWKPARPAADALESALDDYRAAMLEQAHQRQAFELQALLNANTAKIKLEAAAYRAMLDGVPESDIYGLGEDMADALSSAMETVAGA